MIGIVPIAVRLKVATYLLIAATVITALALAPWSASARIVVIAAIVLPGLYLVWCLWPRWQWGLPTHRLGTDMGADVGADGGPCITFDDGPTRGLTDEILDRLAARGVRASFFVLVAKAEREPQLIQRMLNEGHCVGLHGWDHRTALGQSRAQLKLRLGDAKTRLERLTGQTVTLFRPSHGWKTWSLRNAARDLNLTFCFWDRGVWDTDSPSAQVLTARLQLALTPPRGDRTSTRNPVVLLHDGRGDEPGRPAHADVLLESLSAVLSKPWERK